jgi:predicted MFS family arabinose efflux permease
MQVQGDAEVRHRQDKSHSPQTKMALPYLWSNFLLEEREMKRIVVGSILVGAVTMFALFDVGELPWITILVFCLFWYSIFGWMIFSGYRAIRRSSLKSKK